MCVHVRASVPVRVCVAPCRPLNCFSLKAASDFAAGVIASEQALDYLVMSQGMATLQGCVHAPQRVVKMPAVRPFLSSVDSNHPRVGHLARRSVCKALDRQAACNTHVAHGAYIGTARLSWACRYTPTTPEEGGLDQKLTLHYWSRMLLAKRLAPLLEGSTDGRVLSVLSAGVCLTDPGSLAVTAPPATCILSCGAVGAENLRSMYRQVRLLCFPCHYCC